MCDWLKELSNRVLPIVLALVCFIISEGPVAQAHFFFLMIDWNTAWVHIEVKIRFDSRNLQTPCECWIWSYTLNIWKPLNISVADCKTMRLGNMYSKLFEKQKLCRVFWLWPFCFRRISFTDMLTFNYSGLLSILILQTCLLLSQHPMQGRNAQFCQWPYSDIHFFVPKWAATYSKINVNDFILSIKFATYWLRETKNPTLIRFCFCFFKLRVSM